MIAAMKRVVLLISGRGSNMQAFMDAIDGGRLDAQIAAVISNKPDAAGLDIARAAGIEAVCIDHRNFESREAFDGALAAAVTSYSPDLVILAGFMRILTPVFVDRFAGRLMNIHPSLLPKYPGLNTHQRAIDAGDEEAGATVHYVTSELDGGPAILQARVPILGGDTAQTLAARILPCEHTIYPLAAQWHLAGRLTLEPGGAVLDGAQLGAQGMIWQDGLS